MARLLTLLVLIASAFSQVLGDTPANCSYEDIRGWWTFTESSRTGHADIVCDGWTATDGGTSKLRVFLEFPNVATDEWGSKGTWTLIYNQGFEITINYRKYFAFSNFTDFGNGSAISHCGSTKTGWSHDVLGKNWACFVGRRDVELHETAHRLQGISFRAGEIVDPYNSEEFADLINSVQSSWKAEVHTPFKGKTLNEMMRLRGGHRNRHLRSPGRMNATEEQRMNAAALPETFDWRNVSGVNYVSPVRNQGNCGSCYSFASMAMLESRIRIASRNTQKPVFSPQDVVSCSPYSQGCEGGFPYLIGGKYAQDFGVVEESCSPYEGKDMSCHTSPSCARHYVAGYRYTGGFYGASNEEVMRLALVRGGPLAVGFMVYPDFQLYKGGVYRHTGVHRYLRLGPHFDPFETTNHAVLVVGYGVDEETGLKYWSVKNSWGPEWGEDGYFRIVRGEDECGFESLAVEAEPIL